MELAPLKMRSVERRHIGIHLERLDTAVTDQLARKLQRPRILEQMCRKAVLKGKAPNLERRLSPQPARSACRYWR